MQSAPQKYRYQMVESKIVEDFKIKENIPKGPKINMSLLVILEDGESRSMNEITEILGDYFKLTKEEKELRKPSGSETIFHNRVHWSKYNLKKSGLIMDVSKGIVVITQKGKDVLKKNPSSIDTRDYATY
jgi:restriction system protein